MAASPVVDGKHNDAEGKARNVVVKSDTMDMVNGEGSIPQTAVPTWGDPVMTFDSLDKWFADDDVQFSGDEHGDSTECSSSFGVSCSESDGGESDTCVMEVDSLFHSPINVDDTSVVAHLVRKKKVTADWRKFIGPQMWRCQWLELRMKDLLSQVAKYDKELALINNEKDLQLEIIKADSPRSKLSQIDLQSHEKNTIRRRKRKRHEDIMDTLLYTEKHQILSYYYEKQKKKTETDELLDNDDSNSSAADDTKSNLGLNDTILESKQNDTILEQYYLRDILLSIDGIQSRIMNLRNHLSGAQNNIYQKAQKKKKKDLRSLQKKDVGRHIESADDVLIDNQAAMEEACWQFEKVNQRAETHLELVKSVFETPLSKEEEIIAQVGCEHVLKTAPIVKLVNKRVSKPKKKQYSSQHRTEDLEDHNFNNQNTQKTVLVAVDTRRSQRVRKQKNF